METEQEIVIAIPSEHAAPFANCKTSPTGDWAWLGSDWQWINATVRPNVLKYSRAEDRGEFGIRRWTHRIALTISPRDRDGIMEVELDRDTWLSLRAAVDALFEAVHYIGDIESGV